MVFTGSSDFIIVSILRFLHLNPFLCDVNFNNWIKNNRIQVSDLHISNFQDESRITNLRQFCDSTVSIIEPSLVLASGEFLTKLLTLVAADHNLEDLRVFKGVYLCSRLCREGCKYENGIRLIVLFVLYQCFAFLFYIILTYTQNT